MQHLKRALRQGFLEVLETRRLLSAGALDPSFSGDGQATVNFGSGITVSAIGEALQSDGKLVLVGRSSTQDFAVARFNIDGSLDTAFGPNHNGTILTPGSGVSQADAVAIQADGKIVVAGTAQDAGGDASFQVMRYNPNGTIDTSFDHDGRIAFRTHHVEGVAAVAIQSDGKIVVGGTDLVGGLNRAVKDTFAIARLNTNGSLDSSFNGNGIKEITFGNEDSLTSLLIRGTTILAIGTSIGGTPLIKVAIAALNKTGGMENSFDGDGKFTAVFPGAVESSASSALLQSDGKIVIVGQVGLTDFAMARFNANGGEDTTFGSAHNGWVKVDLGHSNDNGFGIIHSADGGLIAGATSGGFDQFLGFSANGVLDTTFGTNGKVTEGFGGGAGLVAGPGRRFVTTGGDKFHTARLLEAGANLVSVTSLNPTGSEAGPTPATFFVFRSERLPTPLSVYLSISGTATSQLTRVPFAKADYTGITAPPPPVIGGAGGNTVPAGPNIALVVIPANQTFTEVTITPIDDAIPEKTETAIFTILSNPAYEAGAPTSTTLFITDNDSKSTTVNASADAYVKDGTSAGTNFGSTADLQVKKGGSGFNRESFLKFDLSSVSTINTVTLQLFGKLSDTQNTNVATSLFSVADTSWTESGIDFNNKPAAGASALATATILDNTARLYTFDVTAYVKAQKAAGHNVVSFVLINSASTGSFVTFNSREAGSNGPQLNIT